MHDKKKAPVNSDPYVEGVQYTRPTKEQEREGRRKYRLKRKREKAGVGAAKPGKAKSQDDYEG